MKRILVCIVLAFLAFPAVAKKQTLVRLQGWVVDSRCGAKNAHEGGGEDTLACHKDGAKLVFVAKDGGIYDISDQERALEHVGPQISIFGTVDGAKMLNIGRYIGREEGRRKSPEDKGGIAPAGVGKKSP